MLNFLVKKKNYAQKSSYGLQKVIGSVAAYQKSIYYIGYF